MTPDPRSARPQSTHVEPLRTAARLQLKPTVPTTGYVDGAWWPRSRELPTELPALFAALADRLGRIALVVYHLEDWDEAPRVLDVDGGGVRLEGFNPPSAGPHALVVIRTDGRRVTMLVVGSDAGETAAQQALASASRPAEPDTGHSTNSAADDNASQALTDVATRLARRESPRHTHDTATITAWVQEAAHQFTDAPIQAFVPILVEHIVRDRLATTSARP